MNKLEAIKYAETAGRNFAKTQRDAGIMTPNEVLPEFDYIDLKERFGVKYLSELESAYRRGYNAQLALRPV